MKRLMLLFACAFSLLMVGEVFAGSEEDDLEAMQRQMNAEVMAQDFDAGDQARINAYIEEAMKKDLKPPKAPPSYWQPGYTCANIRHYGYTAYRDCRYHYRYYGRYW